MIYFLTFAELEKKPKKLKLVPVSEGIFNKASAKVKKQRNLNDNNINISSDNNNINNNNNNHLNGNNIDKIPISKRLGKRTITIPQGKIKKLFQVSNSVICNSKIFILQKFYRLKNQSWFQECLEDLEQKINNLLSFLMIYFN